ncbi:predicted protein [Naegleria gruberi]|uniref:Predicted protein n=1 Tax=Naegleria gruberi TaxID=5762 RepID=D2VQP6_NAEGR|nr:uncharacterized protein NAEGRDRAFT_51501 [Naegleria gruberi]EFC40908.1 predicted protein [Naegleria gruberi]|eukprot:XP_002673652.1 predicted protein [Naegleria gruberi strain NEG-M]
MSTNPYLLPTSSTSMFSLGEVASSSQNVLAEQSSSHYSMGATGNEYNPSKAGTMSHTGSESIKSADTLSTTSEGGIRGQTKLLITTTLVSLQDSSPKKGWRCYVSYLLVFIYMFWCQVFVPTLGNYGWGEYGTYVLIHVLNFPNTFLVHLIPFYGYLAITIATILFVLTMAVLYIVGVRLATKPNKHFNKFKVLVYYLSFFVKTFSLPIVYILVGLLDCNSIAYDVDGDPIPSLRRYSSQSCTDDLNIIMMIISVISLLILLPVYFFSESITANSNPHNRTPLMVESSFPTSIIGVISLIQLIIGQLIPSNYMYISAALQLLLSVIATIIAGYSLPCFRIIDNSLYFGMNLAKVGASIGSVVASSLNTANILNTSDPTLGWSLMTLGLMILFFVIGVAILEVFQRIQLKRARSFILNWVQQDETAINSDPISPLILIEKNAMNIYGDAEDAKLLGLLRHMFKCSILEARDAKGTSYTNSDLSSAFVKGAASHNSFNDLKLLIYSSILLETKWNESNNTVFSLNLLKRAMKQHPNGLEQITIRERIKQVENFSQTNFKNLTNFELSSQLDLLEKNQNILLTLHRNFWKELASEKINYDSVEKINRAIHSLTIDCRTTLQNLMYNHKNNKTIYRLYANFIESFEFDSDLAQQYYNEANSIEEEEMKRKRRMSTFSNNGKRGGNRVVPVMNEYKFGNAEAVEDQDLDEMESAFDNPKVKKEQVFKTAISNQRSNRFVFTSTLLYGLLCFSFITASLVLSVYYSKTSKNNIPYLQQVCAVSVAPFSVFRNVRAGQNWMNFYMLFENVWPAINPESNTKTRSKSSYVTSHKQRMLDDLAYYDTLVSTAQSKIFDSDSYIDYSENVYPFAYPNEDKQFNYNGALTIRNISVQEITNNMIKYTKKFYADVPDTYLLASEAINITYAKKKLNLDLAANSTYFNPLANYNFMVLYSNIERASNAYDAFCGKYLDRSTSTINDTINLLIYYTVTLVGFFLLSSFAYLIFMLVEMTSMKRIMKLYEKQLSKDVIGKIYHTLDKKTTEVADSQSKGISLNRIKPSVILIGLILLIILVTVTCLVLLFVESYENSITSSQVMASVRLTVQAAAILQRLSFAVGEVATYFVASETSNTKSPLASSFPRKVTFGDPSLYGIDIASLQAFLVARINTRLPQLSSMWSKLIYGDAASGREAILGKFDDVDQVIVTGITNCTDYMAKNNITYGLETSYQYCVGFEELFGNYLTTVAQLVTDSKKQYALQQAALSTTTLLPTDDLQLRHNNAMRMALSLTSKFVKFIQEFVDATSSASYIIAIISTIISYLLCTVFFFFLQSTYQSYDGQLHTLRIMAHYIPVDVLDRNEQLKNFILYNTTKTEKKKKSLLSKEGFVGGSSLEDLKNIFNSNIEGTTICNSKFEIEFFNAAALKMFGMQSIDVLGVSMGNLIEPTQKDELINCMDHLMKKKTGENNLKKDEIQTNDQCEVLELDCIRRNQTKFPCKITLIAVKVSDGIGQKPILIVSLKDLTSEKKQNALLSEEKQKSDNLLKNILPMSVASRLKSGHTFIAEKLDDITCFFSDMVGFTAISSGLQATDLVMMLNSIVNGFDLLTEKYDLEKIKTIGDAYFCVGGLPGAATSDHPERVLKFAIETFGVINDFNANNAERKSVTDNQEEYQPTEEQSSPIKAKINIRVGINTGAVVAGVIGMKKFAYDLWGDTINTASRMESTSKNGRIQISRSTYERVFDLGYEFEEREVDVKGKGIVKTYLLNDKHHRYLKNNPLMYSAQKSASLLFTSQQ